VFQMNSTNPLRFFHSPLLIELSAVQGLMGTLNTKAGLLEFTPQSTQQTTVTRSAVISVHGVLTHRPDIISMLFGDGTDYMTIREQFQAALDDDDYDRIILDVDSPGGEVAGLFDLADDIYNARGKKPIIAVLNEVGYSAAYGLASSADRVYAPRTGGAGSIGVIAVHVDQSKYDENLGVAYEVIKAGEKKNDFDPHSPLSSDARARIQAVIDADYELFVNLVARNRKLDPSVVRGQEAGLYIGKGAVEAGLIDAVQSWKQVASKYQIRRGGFDMQIIVDQVRALISGDKATDEVKVFEAMGYVPKLAEGAVVLSDVELKGKVDEAVTAAVKTAKDEGVVEKDKALADAGANLTGMVELCGLTNRFDLLGGFINDKLSLEDAKKKLLAEQAKPGAVGTGVISSVSGLSDGANALLDNAKKRAEKK